MNILIAPDSFKESLSATEVADAIENGLKQIWPQAHFYKKPIADGGEGTVDAMVKALDGDKRRVSVSGPLGEPVEAEFGLVNQGKTAIIEMAACSGLNLVSVNQRNPMLTTTYGLGELMQHALNLGVTHFIIGLGGSATNDAGAGMLLALGAKLLDHNGEPVTPAGGYLEQVVDLDLSGLDARWQQVSIEVACDVENPLTGPNGASYIFGPQKGADAKMLGHLDRALAHFGELLERSSGQPVMTLAGAGAAGGLGAALVAALGANLKRGVEIVLDALQLSTLLPHCDLVVTGEGRMDSQSVMGKAPIGVARLAKSHRVPVMALAGSLGAGYEAVHEEGVSAVFCILPGICTLPDALEQAWENLSRTSENMARCWASSRP